MAFHDILRYILHVLSLFLSVVSQITTPKLGIGYVYHHHAKVATADDPVTAPRGRKVYVHVIKAIIGTNTSALKIESKRLQRRQQALFSWHNRYLRGWLMTAVILLGSGLLGGLPALLVVSLIGLFAKFFLEVVNYMEHYGLVRDPKQMVQPKHSWNSNKKISCWAMFNLPRHSHHHAKGAVPFEKLAPMGQALCKRTRIGYFAATGNTQTQK